MVPSQLFEVEKHTAQTEEKKRKNLHINLHSSQFSVINLLFINTLHLDTADLKSADPYQVVGVQVPLRAPK
jgi:hypothetical protein